MQVIDCHTHVISSNSTRHPVNPIGGHRSVWSEERPVDAAGLLAAMDDAGIETSVVVQASTVYGHDNSYVAESIAAHPDRLVGVFSLDVLAPDAASTLERWMAAGFSGFRLFTTGTTMPGQAGWLDDPRSFPVWEYAEAHGIPVCLQMTAEGIPMLETLLQQFPKVRVLLDHLARPKLEDGPPYAQAAGLFDLARHPGVFLKLTNRTLASAAQGKSTPADFLDAVIGHFGAGRIAWGSNFPAAEGSMAALLAEARAAIGHLPQNVQQEILFGTITNVYPRLREICHA